MVNSDVLVQSAAQSGATAAAALIIVVLAVKRNLGAAIKVYGKIYLVTIVNWPWNAARWLRGDHQSVLVALNQTI